MRFVTQLLQQLIEVFILLKVKELRYDYTQCENKLTPGQTCASYLDSLPLNATSAERSCSCQVNLTLTEDYTVLV